LAALSIKERDNALLAPKAFSEEDLNKFIDNLPSKEQPSTKKKSKP
jgi:hypothetical protein